jgi:hypothetical protein
MTETHDFVLEKNGIASTFVWIPAYRAYQLINPTKCGYMGQPEGVWVSSEPIHGKKDVDWAVETFGGFYAGKYEASRADAEPDDRRTGEGATEGTSDHLKVASYCVPWTGVTWDKAVSTCAAYDPACHLMTDDEWTALAVWSMIQGVRVYGNNGEGKATYDRNILFKHAGSSAIALTGIASKTGWPSPVNHTTHSGTTGGVYDLNGNVGEWTATLGSRLNSNRYLVNGIETGTLFPGDGWVVNLCTDRELRRYGVPGITRTADQSLSTLPFFGDYLVLNTGNSTSAIRGSSGIWGISLILAKEDMSEMTGFRPSLRY